MNALPRLHGPAAERLLDSGMRIAITGAGGWIGRATLELLHETLGTELFNQKVVAFGSSRRVLDLRGGLQVEQSPLSELPSLEAAPTIVLHLAFLTKDRAEAMDEDEYSRANRAVSKHVLDSLDRIGAQAVFVASSGAAAYADDATAAPAMRLYGALKREEEVAFSQWAEQRGRRAVVCRLFALSGPYINKHQNYALASFIIDALARRPITVRASRPVLRGYVAIREVMSLAFAMLLESERGVVRFETGGAPMEMQAIAEEISAQLGPVPVHRPQVADGDRDEYLGNHDDYRRILSDYGVESVTFAQQVTETAAFFLSEKERMRVASTGAAC